MCLNSYYQSIRIKVIGVFEKDSRILAGKFKENGRKEGFFCPPGGGMEFGEMAEDTLRREILEELGEKVQNISFLGIIENHFSWEGKPSHEIVLAYRAEFQDASIYKRDSLVLTESNGEVFVAYWVSLDAKKRGGCPLFPSGLTDLLSRGN